MRATMLLLLMALTSISAWADNVTYFDPTDAVNPTKTAENPTVITSETTEIGSEGQTTWYYVSGTVTNGNRIEVKGTVNIILVDDCVFTASKGIRVESPNVLNIYAQKADDGCGKLIAKHEGKNAAIGSNGGPVAYGNGPDINEPDNFEGTTPDAANAPEAGTITIYGGDIYVNGNIGGGDGGDGHPSNNKSGIGGKGGDGTIIIHDGNIVVYGNMGGGKGGYGHGVELDENRYQGGQGGNGGAGTVTINGGYVNVYGDMGGGYYGDGNDQHGNEGSGDVSFSWSKPSDMFGAQSYNGTVHLLKPFMDSDEKVYKEDDYEDGISGDARIINKLLYPYGTMYDITIGGNYDPACLNPNKTRAMEGEEIKLTAVNGYKVSSVTVTDADVTDNQNGTWTFTMPAKAVTVTPTATRFYQVSSSSNISYDVANANDKMVQNSKTFYRPGSTVNLEVTVPDGYIIQSLTIKDEDDQNVSYSANGTNAYTFTMPTKAVTMEAVTMRDFSGLTLIEGTAAFKVTDGTDDGYDDGPENLLDGKYSSTDDSNYSKWVVDDVTTGCYVEFNTPAPVVPKHYTLISTNSYGGIIGCYPTSWTIKAKVSADKEWTTIAAESNNNTMSDEQTCHSYLFDFDNPGNNAYKYFRFEVTAVEGWVELGDEWNPTFSHNWLELSEMQMYVRGETLTANDDGNGNYWATYYNGSTSYATDGNTTIYKGKKSDNNVLLTQVDDIPAGNAVILKSKVPTITLMQTTKSADFTDNDLHGVSERTQIATSIYGASTLYVMGNTSKGFGFHKYTGTYMPANKAFLALGSTSSAPLRMVFFDDDDTTTAIESLSHDAAGQEGIYDLQGRKVNQPSRGLYIVNGKKVMIK